MSRGSHKIKNDFGMVDYYNYYAANTDSPVERRVFNNIVSDFNKEIQRLIIEEGLIYLFPKLFLELMLKKVKRKPRISDGKLVNNLPIDWKATNLLWERDEEAKSKKILIRLNNTHTSGFVFYIYCKKFKSSIKGRGLYKFTPTRGFRRSLSKAIFNPNKEIDAYLLY